MKSIEINISKSEVFEEVAKTTAYIGAKKVEGSGAAYDRIFTTNDDKNMLERFWLETADVMTNILSQFLNGVPSTSSSYTVGLVMSDRFDTNLSDSLYSSICSYFVNSILSKWCDITDKDNVKEYTDKAGALLVNINDMLFFKKKPTRKIIKK